MLKYCYGRNLILCFSLAVECSILSLYVRYILNKQEFSQVSGDDLKIYKGLNTGLYHAIKILSLADMDCYTTKIFGELLKLNSKENF